MQGSQNLSKYMQNDFQVSSSFDQNLWSVCVDFCCSNPLSYLC